MTYRRWMAARQLLAEEGVGFSIRQAAAQEDAAFLTASKNLQRIK